MRRIFSGAQRNAIINHDGCCVSCGFIEHGLFATEAKDGSFETLCEECLAPKNLENFSETKFQAAYLPELSGPVVAHFSRVAAWYYFAARMGKQIDTDCCFDGLLPIEVSTASWWTNPLSIQSFKALKTDVKASITQIRQMRKAAESYAFLKNRVDATQARYGFISNQELWRTVGAESFYRDFRLIPVAIPVSRIRSWGKGSTFSNHPVSVKNDPESPSFSFDDIFNNPAEE